MRNVPLDQRSKRGIAMVRTRGLSCSILLLINIPQLFAQWVPANGPPGGHIKEIVRVNGILFASTSGGVLRSDDSGISWRWTNFEGPAVSLAAVDSVLFASSNESDEGLRRSTDLGETWSVTGMPTHYVTDIHASAAKIYYGTVCQGTWRSGDYGLSWELFTPYFPAAPLPWAYKIGSVGDVIFVSWRGDCGAGGKPDRIWRKAEDGGDWTQIFMPGSDKPTSYAILDSVIVAGTPLGLYRSVDDGFNWTQVDTLQANPFTSVLSVGPFFLAGCSEGVWVSSDHGETWSSSSEGLTDSYVEAMIFDGSRLFVGTKYGMFESADVGLSWTDRTGGFMAQYVEDLMKYDSHLLAGARNGLYLSVEEETEWIRRNNGIALPSGWGGNQIALVNAGEGVSLAASNFHGYYRSTNQGSYWNWIHTPHFGPSKFLSKHPYLFAGTLSVHRSSDGGLTWEETNSGLNTGEVNGIIALDDTLYIGTWGGSDGPVFRSIDNGETWTERSEGFLDLLVTSLEVIGGSPPTLFAGTGVNGIFRSTNGGQHWEQANNGLENLAIQTLFVHDLNIYASTSPPAGEASESGGIYRSEDRGDSWVSIGDGLDGLPVFDLIVRDEYLYAATPRSVWRRPLSEVADLDEEPAGIPKRFALHQNYPNPFNAISNFGFGISDLSFVSLKVYDLLGREVATIVDEKLAPGSYTREWDATGLASGVYLYRMTAGEFIETRKLILIR